MRRFFETADVEDFDNVSDDSEEEQIEEQKQIQNEMQRLQDKLRQRDGEADRRRSRRSIFVNDLKGNQGMQVDIQQEIENQVVVGKSLYLFGAKNKFRKILAKLVHTNQFEIFIVIMILVSSILLALEDPLKDNTNFVLALIDLVITIIFVVEALLKIIALGFIINGEFSYLRQSGNILDFTVIIFSLLALTSSDNSAFATIKILRVLKVLRPLRLIARNEGLKIAINALILSIPQILNLVIVCTIFFLLFGIFGVNQFKGSFYYCDVGQEYLDSVFTRTDCFDYGGNWVNSDFNFDNILNAMSSLFVISTTEGWIEMMNLGTDSRGIHLQPK